MPKVQLTKASIQYNRFNDYVRGELIRRKIRQTELAEYLNVSAVCISLRLSGKCEWPFRAVLDTCDFFGIDIREIFQ